MSGGTPPLIEAGAPPAPDSLDQLGGAEISWDCFAGVVPPLQGVLPLLSAAAYPPPPPCSLLPLLPHPPHPGG